MIDHTDIVASVKADLERRGVSLVGPCGAFEITKRVAFLLRDRGAGLLMKPSGNNCTGFAVDIIVERSGVHYDILVNGGGDEDPYGSPIPGTGNGPCWNIVMKDGQPLMVDPARWAAPWEMLDGPGPLPGEVPPPPPPTPAPGPAGPAAPPTPGDASALATAVLNMAVAYQGLSAQVNLLRAEVMDLKDADQRGLRGSLLGYTITLQRVPKPEDE